MNIKNKILAALLIFVFVASISAVVAEDVADAETLAADNDVDSIAVNEEDNAPVAPAEAEAAQEPIYFQYAEDESVVDELMEDSLIGTLFGH